MNLKEEFSCSFPCSLRMFPWSLMLRDRLDPTVGFDLLQVAGAQLCWAVAGASLHWAPVPGEPPRLSLLGADLAATPRSARDIAALQRTQLYVWAVASGAQPFTP